MTTLGCCLKSSIRYNPSPPPLTILPRVDSRSIYNSFTKLLCIPMSHWLGVCQLCSKYLGEKHVLSNNNRSIASSTALGKYMLLQGHLAKWAFYDVFYKTRPVNTIRDMKLLIKSLTDWLLGISHTLVILLLITRGIPTDTSPPSVHYSNYQGHPYLIHVDVRVGWNNWTSCKINSLSHHVLSK